MAIPVNLQGVATHHSGKFKDQLSDLDNKQLLLAFSLGCHDSDFIKATLGIESDEQLFLLMARAALQMPVLPQEMTLAMAAELHALPCQ